MDKNILGDKNLYRWNETLISELFSIDDNLCKNIIEKLKKEFLYGKKKPKIKKVLMKDIVLINVGGFGIIFNIQNTFCLKLVLENNIHEFEVPLLLKKKNKIFDDILTVPYTLISNKNIYNFINLITITKIVINIAISLYKNKIIESKIFTDKFTKIDNEYLENKKIIEISDSILNLVLENNKIDIFSKFNSLLRIFDKKKYTGNIMMLPLAYGESLNFKINNETQSLDYKGLNFKFFYPDTYKILFLQIGLSLLYFDKYKIIHNDLKPNNVLVFEKESPYFITFEDLSFIFKVPFVFKISDFDFAISLDNEFENKKLSNTKLIYNRSWFQDFHFFIHKFFFFIGKIDDDDKKFFQIIYDIFLKNYCCEKNNLDDLLDFQFKILYKDKTLCNDGRFFTNIVKKNYSINILKKFLKNDCFKKYKNF